MDKAFQDNDILIPESQTVPLVGLSENYPNLSSEPHSHEYGQLYYCASGAIKVQIASGVWLVAPHRAVWIPQGVTHHSRSKQSVSLRILYVNQNYYPNLPKETTVIQVSTLLRELIEAVIQQGNQWSKRTQEARLAQVTIDKIISAPQELLYLPLPEDSRALLACQLMQKKAELHLDIQGICQQAGLSQRTLVRILQAELKMSLQQWKQQLLLMKSIEMISEKKSITRIAMDLGYANPSAFITMFKKALGVSPNEYTNRHPQKQD
jgi:AraC-like DNA-binding protein/mannose-6-phosphate isomerase-like protein (cupin superfamily)